MEEQNVKQKELTYEELKNVAVQLQQRCMNLENKLRSIEVASVRLNYLFKIVKYKESFSNDFVLNCIKEIEDLITIEEESTIEETTSEE